MNDSRSKSQTIPRTARLAAWLELPWPASLS